MHHIQYITLKTGDTQKEKTEIYKPGKKFFYTFLHKYAVQIWNICQM